MMQSLHVLVPVCLHSSKPRSTKDARSGSRHKVSLAEISMPVEFNDISVAIVISALTLIFTHKPDIGPNVLARLMFIYQLRTPHHVKRIF